LQKQIADLRNLAAMTVDDEKIALRPQADELQNQLDAARYDVVRRGIPVGQLQGEKAENTVVLQRTSTALTAAHGQIRTIQQAAEADAALGMAGRLGDNETANKPLQRLCTQLEDRLYRVASLPGGSSIPKLVEMAPKDNIEWVNTESLVVVIDSSFDSSFDYIPLLTGGKPAAPRQQQQPTLDLDFVIPIPMAPVELLGNQLNTPLEDYKKDCAQRQGTASDIEQMIQTHTNISQNDKSLTVRIKEFEADIAALTNTTTLVDCSQCATELRPLNEQAVTAVPDIGFRGRLPPTFGAAEYIDESARYIQELLNQITQVSTRKSTTTKGVPAIQSTSRGTQRAS
jgi:hypothetical protein